MLGDWPDFFKVCILFLGMYLEVPCND
jgi:hypothetical protein